MARWQQKWNCLGNRGERARTRPAAVSLCLQRNWKGSCLSITRCAAEREEGARRAPPLPPLPPCYFCGGGASSRQMCASPQQDVTLLFTNFAPVSCLPL